MAKRRSKGEGSKFKRIINGKEYFIAEKSIDGKTVTAYSSKSQSEANKKLEAKIELKENDTDITIEILFTKWLEFKKNKLKIQSYQSYKRDIDNYIIPEFGNRKINLLTSQELENYYSLLVNKGLSPSSVKRLHAVVRSCLQYALKNRLIKENQAKDSETPKVFKKEMNILNKQDMENVLKNAEGTNMYLPIKIALQTGMREGEILGLKGKDILDNAIHVQRTVVTRRKTKNKEEKLDFAPPKNNKDRIVTVKDTLIQELNALNKKSDELLFPSPRAKTNHNIWIPRSFVKSWHIVREKANLNNIRFHDLRHTHISYLLQNGASATDVCLRVGHKSPDITMRIYAHITHDSKLDIASLLPENI